jgi:hypothetical protein
MNESKNGDRNIDINNLFFQFCGVVQLMIIHKKI